MTTKQLPGTNAAGLTFDVYSQQAHSFSQLSSRLHLDPAQSRHYLEGGLIEEYGEIIGESDDRAYSRAEVFWAPLYKVNGTRVTPLQTVFPEQIVLHQKEFADLLWYLSERLAAEPDIDGDRLSLHRAANAGLRAIDSTAQPVTMFAELDQHSYEHPFALRIPHPLYQQSLPDSTDMFTWEDSMRQKAAEENESMVASVFPENVDMVYSSGLIFNHCVNGVVCALDHLERGQNTPAVRQELLVKAGQVLWAASFILRERLGSSLASTAALGLAKAAARTANDTVFGQGDRR